MSPIFIVVFAILLAFSDCLPSKESDMKVKIEAAQKECAELNSVSIEDVMKRKTADPNAPVTENMMCFDKCLFEKLGMVGPDGQIKIDEASEGFLAGQPEAAEMVKAALTKCNLLGGGQNTCAAISTIAKCSFNAIMPKQ